MRVLVDGRTGWGSGIGRVIAQTVPRVADHLGQHRFDLLVQEADADRAREAVGDRPNLDVRVTDLAPFSLREQQRLPALAHGYDLTWFTNYWVPLRYRGRFAVTVHDLLHLEPALFPAGRAKRGLSRLTFGKVRRDAAAVMFDSRFTEREFTRLIGAPRRGQVVHLGADHLAPTSTTAPRDKQLLVVAASKKHKNFDVVLRAWAATKGLEDWRLVIVTPNEQLRSSVEVMAAADGASRVTLLQGVTDAELARLYASSAVLLMPTRYEGFGLPLLEGMVARTWCMAAPAESLVEIGQGGFVQFVNATDPAGWTEAIEATCAMIARGTVDLAPLLAHNAVHAARFTWARTADTVAALLADLLSSSHEEPITA